MSNKKVVSKKGKLGEIEIFYIKVLDTIKKEILVKNIIGRKYECKYKI